ncbi:aminoglycoside phosphotransferase family protein [Crossiella cryophila]|uniref:Aminoglycoside phosphotransferase (APT) family kinase protein n=1 Tax=Crossiella cryophila TaxID=43355 RepID=A0A7W7FX76_9PSEU|nr:aminoglycoside phosphotransferase family protein [Crossiella cryophila]MBB4680333.1 aminoglycoside phosphotransferase (APT) family kinase protein [Crossiella cryophila]
MSTVVTKMHADEVELDVTSVRNLLTEQFPHWADLPLSRLASAGTDNAMFRLGPDMVVRLPRIAGSAGQVAFEQRWLPRLAPELPTPVPVPLGHGVPGTGFPWHWSVFRWLDGENPTVDQLDDPARLATDLAEFITALHRVAPDGPPCSRGRALSTRDEPTRHALSQLDAEIDVPAVTALWEQALRVPAWTGAPVWLHSDLSPGNVLHDQGRLSGVIDFGAAGTGDPAVDLLPAWNLLPASVREEFRTATGVDAATWARGRGWALSISLIQLPYYLHTNPALVASSRHVLREILADAAIE